MKPFRTPASAAGLEPIAARWVLRREAGLTPAEEAELQAWLAADSRHGEAFARKESAWSTLARPHRHGQAEEILARLGTRAGQRRRRRQLALGTAAALVLGAISWTLLPPGDTADPAVGRGIVLRPAIQRLPDGSVVDLRPGARLNVDFDGDHRRVHLLAGTAYFAVARDPARPFVVQAGEVNFRAVGTQFAVELENARVDLLVTEGRVAVETGATPTAESTAGALASPAVSPAPARPSTATLVTVDSGHRLEVARTGPAAAAPLPPAPLSPTEITERLAWRAPRLEFSELPLAEAIALLNRYNPVPLRLTDPTLAHLRVSGVIRADNPDGFLRLVATSFDLEGHQEGGAIVIRRRPG